MSYDDSFDQTRLDQLAEQHLKNSSMTARILFFANPEDGWLDLATWQFDNDEDYEAVKGSDFKLQLMELMGILLTYRAQHNQPNASQGVVYMDKGKLSIEWLPKEQVEAMRNGDSET